MAINVADNFSYKGSKPLDARIKYETVSAMAGAATADLYDGCLAYVAATKKYYSYDNSNTTDPTTGKWREYSSGGGGTEYTAGDGIIIEEGEISTDNMPSSDMSEIVTPLPGVMSRRFKYSTSEQIVGEWIDGKPLYQKTVDCGALPNTSEKTVAHNISNIDNIIEIQGIAIHPNGVFRPIPILFDSNEATRNTSLQANRTSVIITCNGNNSGYTSSYVTLQYTKTTD